MKLSDTDIDNLLTDLSSKDAEQRKKAERFYNNHKVKITPYLLNYLDSNIRTVQFSSAFINGLAFIPLGFCMVVFFVLLGPQSPLAIAVLGITLIVLLMSMTLGVVIGKRVFGLAPKY